MTSVANRRTRINGQPEEPENPRANAPRRPRWLSDAWAHPRKPNWRDAPLPQPPPILPDGIYPFFDKVQVWLGQPLPHDKLRWIKSECREYHVRNKPHQYVRYYQQRLQLVKPSLSVLQYLATINNAFLNYVEVALDLDLR